MGRVKRICALLLAALLLGGGLAPIALAESTAQPQLTVIVLSAPKDLQLLARFRDGGGTDAVQLEKVQKVWETSFRLYFAVLSDMHRAAAAGMNLLVESGGQTFDYPLPQIDFETANHVVTFNYTDKTITMGAPAGRNALLVAVRVGLSLLLSALIFLAFGYRKLKSWLVFLTVNLVAQAALYFLLIYRFGLAGSVGAVPILIAAELLFIVAETLIYIRTLKELGESRAIAFAVASNVAGLFLGFVMLNYLPMPV
ncbi:MAG: hypothetical protein FWC62_03620 [Firmicutes bacterium]|nr:hypothetical protein [Bacillota bacterium]